MPTALEVELKNYAHNLVGDHVLYEYNRQIMQWQQHINLLVDAQKQAFDQHQQVLDDARKQIEREREAGFGFAMLALSFVAGPVLSWVAGKIQYNWFPKFTSQTTERSQLVGTPFKNSPVTTEIWNTHVTFDQVYDKVWAKVFGDLGGAVTGLGIDKTLKVITPQTGTAKKAVEFAANSGETTFRTRLDNAQLAQAKLTSDEIMSLASSINENPVYGAECLERLKLKNPHAQSGKMSEIEQEIVAKLMIREDINGWRRKWATDWLYYGNDPGTINGVAESIELEMWGLWILNENLKHAKGPNQYHPGRVESKTFGGLGIPEPVVRRLADFGVMEARTVQQQVAQNMRRIGELKSSPGTAPAVPIEIGYDLNTASELASLESWATNHHLTSAWQLNPRKRTLLSIEHIYAR